MKLLFPTTETLLRGSSKQKKRPNILVDGQRLSITRSLEAAPRALREFYGGRRFGAGQICINQDNVEEKLSQKSLHVPHIFNIGSDYWMDRPVKEWKTKYIIPCRGHRPVDLSKTMLFRQI